MNKSTVLAKLREHEPELKAAGILRLSLFGSIARGEASPESDIFKDNKQSLRDISDAIGMIEDFTCGMGFEAFRRDPKTVAAVERKLQLIKRSRDSPWR